MTKIKIGIITNGKFVDKYTYDLASWLKINNKHFDFKFFISIPREKKNPDKNKILKKIFFRLIIFFENLILKLTQKHTDHLRKFDIKKIVKKEIIVKDLKKNKLLKDYVVIKPKKINNNLSLKNYLSNSVKFLKESYNYLSNYNSI